MPQIACLGIGLADVEPRVLRRVEVPLDIRLDDLHLVIQVAMPWENAHLYAFRAGRTEWGPSGPGWSDTGFRSAAKSTLADLMERIRGKTFHYLYDFGDDWLHVVKVVKVGEAEAGALYPRLVAAEGACPPEDCGGPYGYADMREAFADPDHEDHDEVSEWLGDDFDPAGLDEAAIRDEMARLAKHLSRRKGRAANRRSAA